jgi:hypothetical protein
MLRFQADKQIRERFTAMLPNCPHPRLWALSLLGTSLRVYTGDVATGGVKPGFASRPRGRLPGDYLQGAWDADLLSQDGFLKMKEIIRDIHDNTRSLRGLRR